MEENRIMAESIMKEKSGNCEERHGRKVINKKKILPTSQVGGSGTKQGPLTIIRSGQGQVVIQTDNKTLKLLKNMKGPFVIKSMQKIQDGTKIIETTPSPMPQTGLNADVKQTSTCQNVIPKPPAIKIASNTTIKNNTHTVSSVQKDLPVKDSPSTASVAKKFLTPSSVGKDVPLTLPLEKNYPAATVLKKIVKVTSNEKRIPATVVSSSAANNNPEKSSLKKRIPVTSPGSKNENPDKSSTRVTYSLSQHSQRKDKNGEGVKCSQKSGGKDIMDLDIEKPDGSKEKISVTGILGSKMIDKPRPVKLIRSLQDARAKLKQYLLSRPYANLNAADSSKSKWTKSASESESYSNQEICGKVEREQSSSYIESNTYNHNDDEDVKPEIPSESLSGLTAGIYSHQNAGRLNRSNQERAEEVPLKYSLRKPGRSIVSEISKAEEESSNEEEEEKIGEEDDEDDDFSVEKSVKEARERRTIKRKSDTDFEVRRSGPAEIVKVNYPASGNIFNKELRVHVYDIFDKNKRKKMTMDYNDFTSVKIKEENIVEDEVDNGNQLQSEKNHQNADKCEDKEDMTLSMKVETEEEMNENLSWSHGLLEASKRASSSGEEEHEEVEEQHADKQFIPMIPPRRPNVREYVGEDIEMRSGGQNERKKKRFDTEKMKRDDREKKKIDDVEMKRRDAHIEKDDQKRDSGDMDKKEICDNFLEIKRRDDIEKKKRDITKMEKKKIVDMDEKKIDDMNKDKIDDMDEKKIDDMEMNRRGDIVIELEGAPKVQFHRCVEFCNSEVCKSKKPLVKPARVIANNTECTNSIKALASLPEVLSLRFVDRDHGMGVFAMEELPTGSMLGPVEGKRRTFQDMDMKEDLTYIWMVYTRGKENPLDDKYICMKDQMTSNWCRYVRATVDIDQSNLRCMVDESTNQLYLQSRKTIAPGEELVYLISGSVSTKTSDLNKFTCERCDMKFHSNILYAKHRLIFHTYGMQYLKSQCKVCLTIFESESRLKLHVKVAHDGKGAKKCDVCQKDFLTIKMLNKHKRLMHEITGEHSCYLCGNIYQNEAKLDAHVKSIHRLRTSECDICGRKFKLSGTMKRHRRVHFQRDWYITCEFCGKTCRDISNLKSHLLIHTSWRLYQCKIHGCTAAYNVKCSMELHYIRDHNLTEKEYPPITTAFPYTLEGLTQIIRFPELFERYNTDNQIS